MTTYSSFGLHLLMLTNLTNVSVSGSEEERFHRETMRLSNNCSSIFIRLDNYHHRVELTSTDENPQESIIRANTSCSAHVMTGNKDQGICIHSNDLFFLSRDLGVQLKIYTSKFGPERAFSHGHTKFRHWCTPHSLITLELTTSRDFQNQNGEYRFTFLLSNVTKANINTHFHLDSFDQCNLTHTLQAGEEITISGQRSPVPDKLPSVCQLTLDTKTDEEFTEICLQMEDFSVKENCATKLEVSGFNSRFWPESEVLGCNDTHSKFRSKKELCSGNRFLVVNLSRMNLNHTGMNFKAVVKVKRHPFWEVISKENYELRGLSFVKGLTFFIATINSLAGFGAAILASMFKRPRWFWKEWAESMNAGNHCASVHYEAKCTEVSSTSKAEDVPEVSSY
ncbi:uncharacterized protein LOC106061661 [Biomphalaria glabrata]|uniref:Uncharacterized protein LOC106061661 n=1 Tax=Biomphalaria glabrata TaxID=6526 RepID=A0A9U8E733_BIOGL|nr:uncharacterized protein LOC106061661 [Biomphalaria glabrata]